MCRILPKTQPSKPSKTMATTSPSASYVEAEDTREIIDIKQLNAEISETVAKIERLRREIDEVIAEIEA